MRSTLLIALGLGFAALGTMEVLALDPEERVPSALDRLDAPIDETALDTSLQPGGQMCLTPALAATFAPRQAAMVEERAALDARATELAALEEALETRLADMESARNELQSLSRDLDSAAEGDITHLVGMYSTMKPKKAAEIFDQMDATFAAGFLREMESARAGLIMAEMSAKQSYKVSLLIANRHAEWRRQSAASEPEISNQ